VQFGHALCWQPVNSFGALDIDRCKTWIDKCKRKQKHIGNAQGKGFVYNGFARRAGHVKLLDSTFKCKHNRMSGEGLNIIRRPNNVKTINPTVQRAVFLVLPSVRVDKLLPFWYLSFEKPLPESSAIQTVAGSRVIWWWRGPNPNQGHCHHTTNALSSIALI
jgi:hypothetical protein